MNGRVPGIVGVLALQGAFDAHEQVLRGLGATTRQVRTPADLAAVDSLVVGDPLEAVVYRRITQDEYRNELHAVLLVLPDGRLLVNSTPGVSGR